MKKDNESPITRIYSPSMYILSVGAISSPIINLVSLSFILVFGPLLSPTMVVT